MKRTLIGILAGGILVTALFWAGFDAPESRAAPQAQSTDRAERFMLLAGDRISGSGGYAVYLIPDFYGPGANFGGVQFYDIRGGTIIPVGLYLCSDVDIFWECLRWSD